MLCFKFLPGQVHIIVRQIQGVHNINFVRAVKYRRCHVKAQGLSGKGQVDFQYLSDIHTGRHAQGIQNDVQRTSVRQIRHIFHRKHTGNNTLVAVSSCHLITDGNLSLLCYINAYGLVYTGRKLIAVLSGKYLGIHNDTVFPVGNLQGGIPYFPCLLTEYSTKQSFFCGQFGLSLGSNLTYQDISCTHFRADPDNTSVIQILQGIITHAGDIPCDFFRPQLGIPGFRFIFFNVDGCIYILLYQSLT